MGSSASLDRSKNHNWVEDSGGLPAYVREIARSIEKSGKTLSASIAIALSRVRLWASGKGVTPETQAKAAKALASWEATKAKNKARKVAATGRTYDELELLSLSASLPPWLDDELRLTHGVGESVPAGVLALSRIQEATSDP